MFLIFWQNYISHNILISDNNPVGKWTWAGWTSLNGFIAAVASALKTGAEIARELTASDFFAAAEAPCKIAEDFDAVESRIFDFEPSADIFKDWFEVVRIETRDKNAVGDFGDIDSVLSSRSLKERLWLADSDSYKCY